MMCFTAQFEASGVHIITLAVGVPHNEQREFWGFTAKLAHNGEHKRASSLITKKALVSTNNEDRERRNSLSFSYR